jgi:hypothetical protein
MPIIKGVGKKVTVHLQDSLLPNTTYTFDFTNSIVDNNEKNPLENFTFAFSTGEVIDSLTVSGRLLNAYNLEPMPNIMIGLHSNLDDTAFTKTPFVRTTRTNDKGQFWVRNVSHGSYRIYALNDVNRDYKFDQPGEDIAFIEDTIIPSFEAAMRIDTLWKDSITIDTIREVQYTRFIPDDIQLFLFKEKFARQYMSKSERLEAHQFSLFFNNPPIPEPELTLLGSDLKNGEWLIPEYTEEGKTINYWIKDSTIYKTDTLLVQAKYLKSDSLNQLVPNTDTLRLFVRKGKAPAKKDNKKGDKIDFLGVTISGQSSVEVYDVLKITFSEPVLDLDPSLIKVEQKVDTTWEPRAFEFFQDKLDPLTYYSNYEWYYGNEFRVNIDSAEINSIYGKWNDNATASFKVKSEEEYGNLYIMIAGIEGPGFGELLDGSDKVIGKTILRDGELAFPDIKPGKYYLRYIEDINDNGEWDTGNFALRLQPERVFYYPGYFEVRQNWDLEQNWDVTSTPVNKQKPLEITKNKPEEKKKRRNENATKTNNNNQQNSWDNQNSTNNSTFR